MEFTEDHLSDPLQTGPHAVYEVSMETQRSGWVIAPAHMQRRAVVDAMNREASRRSFGVFSADLMRGYHIW